MLQILEMVVLSNGAREGENSGVRELQKGTYWDREGGWGRQTARP